MYLVNIIKWMKIIMVYIEINIFKTSKKNYFTFTRLYYILN